MTREPAQRLFVALDLPERWKDALGTLQDEMRSALRGRFGEEAGPRWVRPEGIHLTLKFLGETPASAVEALQATLAQTVPSAPGFELRAGSPGSFGDRRAPRVVFITLDGQTDELRRLAERIDTELATVGFARERRVFAPHLTLARLPDALPAETRAAIAEAARAFAAPPVPAWRVGEVALIRSHLGPGGARYETISTYPE